MTKTERLLADILTELRAIRAVVSPAQTVKPKGGASVASITRTTTGEVRESGDGGDVPSQLTPEQRAAMAGWGRQTGRRRDTRPFKEGE